MAIGHLKAGVSPAQAVADLNRVGSWLEKTYPKTDAQMSFKLARPSLAGVALAMLLLGLVATWIPAQRALSIDPLILLRDE